jgi:acetoin utilization protein AcuB
MLVRARMTPNPYTASPDTTLAEALKLTRTHRIRHLPVCEEGALAGIVTDRDLRLAMPPIWAEEQAELQSQLHSRYVREVMIRDIITAEPSMPIEEAARLLTGNRIGCLPIMEDGKLIGIITETDMLRALAELFGTTQPSSRLEVRMPNKPGELARVVRLIGIDHKINITGLVMQPEGDDARAAAIMQLATLNPTPVIRALRKMGYDVGWPSLELDQTPDEGEEFLAAGLNLPNRVPIEF